jgi:serine protease Do
MGTDRGVVVEGVSADGPAEHAGLRLGDVIESVDSKATPSGDELLDIISQASPGAHLKLDFLRDGKTMSADVTVGDWNKIVDANEPPSPKPSIVTPVDSAHAPLGLSVRNLTGEQAKAIARDLRLASSQGVVVTDAKPGSFADDVGLQRYDVILAINHQSVLSVDDFNRIQNGLRPGQDVLFLVAEGDQRGFVTKFLADKLP